MEALQIGLLVLAAVLLSSVIDQIVPKVSSPLIQIGLGVLIALFATLITGVDVNINIDPNLFIVLFIVPLIFSESKNIDKASLWKNRRPVISLAVGLVVIAALAVGFLTKLLVPSMWLAAAFALGAALGPTDAVAVASLSKDINIKKQQKNVLEAESLINDASGIVSFQFALAAAVTGTFSLLDASVSFLVSFFGGILIGIVLGYLANFAIRQVRSLGLENTTFHVLFEVFIPFIVYLVANELGTSGILAVVAAGLIGIISPRTMDPQVSRLNIVSNSVWKVLSFALNGVVFVLLGAQLPQQMSGGWVNKEITNWDLFVWILVITAALYVLRFAWLVLMNLFESKRKPAKQTLGVLSLRELLVMTLSGARGAITLSLVMTIPAQVGDLGNAFSQRSTIIFIASGVIILTLLVATFVVPLIAPKADKAKGTAILDEDEVETVIDIYRAVIEELTANQTPENRRATQKVIRSYNERINRLKDTSDIEIEPNKELRIKALRWEQDYTLELIDKSEIDPMIGYKHLNHLAYVQNLIKHEHRYSWVRRNAFRRFGLFSRAIWQRFTHALPGKTSSQNAEELRSLQIATGNYAISKLREEMASPDAPTEDVSELILEYQRTLAALRAARPSVTAITKRVSDTIAVEQAGLRIELEQVQAMYNADRLSRVAAKRMRENVYLMQIDLEERI
ncbi:cation:proton antiporter [Raoultibacter phocaeensis]|uniref:cation:proton antiporter n=1 Tax=Raoultibacter phocaeensis TaxID=2479841 RepID=UPI00111A523B|nr:sodium:proton antiporter [Raoultibacter phocaeensis]